MTKRPKENDVAERLLWKKVAEVVARVVLGPDGLLQTANLKGVKLQQTVEHLMSAGGMTGWKHAGSTVYSDKGVLRIIGLHFRRENAIAKETQIIKVQRHRDGRITEYKPEHRSEKP